MIPFVLWSDAGRARKESPDEVGVPEDVPMSWESSVLSFLLGGSDGEGDGERVGS